MIYVLVKQTSNSNYYLRYYNKTVLVYSKILTVTRSDIYIETKQRDGYIYLLFGYQVYVAAENATMNLINYFEFSSLISPSLANKTGIDVDSNYLAYFINSNIFVYRLNCNKQYELVTSVFPPSPVKDIQIRMPYIVYLV